MATRQPTTLERLTTAERRLAEQAALLRKQREALVRQRRRMERQARQAHLVQVGQLVEDCGVPSDDLVVLQALLLRVAREVALAGATGEGCSGLVRTAAALPVDPAEWLREVAPGTRQDGGVLSGTQPLSTTPKCPLT